MNLTSGRLKYKPTLAMVVVYCLCCVLLPLGIWGIVELGQNRDQRRAKQADNMAKNPGLFTSRFLRRAAMISWISPLAGFVMVLLAGASHVKPVIRMVVGLYFCVVLGSCILGVIALFGVRVHGKKGLLMPALTGACVSGLIILMFFVALALGFSEGIKERADWRQKRADEMHRNAPAQTNLNHSGEPGTGGRQ